jgi:hypothetical protein
MVKGLLKGLTFLLPSAKTQGGVTVQEIIKGRMSDGRNQTAGARPL